MSISIETTSWDYVQGLIEKEINSAFKLRIKENKKEQNDIAIFKPTRQGNRKDEGERVLRRHQSFSDRWG